MMPRGPVIGPFDFNSTLAYTILAENTDIFVGFEVLRAVVIECLIFWDTTSCRTLKVSRRFGGTRRLHLQVLRISQARNQREAGTKLRLLLHAGFLLGVIS
jgi:hypothetical protein